MSRLIAFGDSFTYGHGLPDSHIPPDLPGPNPSKFAWPQILGNMLGTEVINKSKPGHSNIQILQDILSFDILKTDVVIVGWTFVVRDCIFKKNILGIDTSIKVSPWHKDTAFIKNYFNVHNDYDMAVRAGLYIHHAESYLKTKVSNQHHFCAHQEVLDVMPSFTLIPENFINGKLLPRIDKALDNSHPGLASHQQAAETLYEIINGTK